MKLFKLYQNVNNFFFILLINIIIFLLNKYIILFIFINIFNIIISNLKIPQDLIKLIIYNR